MEKYTNYEKALDIVDFSRDLYGACKLVLENEMCERCPMDCKDSCIENNTWMEVIAVATPEEFEELLDLAEDVETEISEREEQEEYDRKYGLQKDYLYECEVGWNRAESDRENDFVERRS